MRLRRKKRNRDEGRDASKIKKDWWNCKRADIERGRFNTRDLLLLLILLFTLNTQRSFEIF